MSWQSKTFWTDVVRGLSVNNTPFGSPLHGSWMSKKLSLKDPTKHSPVDHRAVNTVKGLLTDTIPGLINTGEVIQANKQVLIFLQELIYALTSLC